MTQTFAMNFYQLRNGIYVADFAHRQAMNFTVLRAAEFYEAKYPGIAGQYFDHADFIRKYMIDKDNENEFDYLARVCAFNLYDYNLRQFAKVFDGKLIPEEKVFLDKALAAVDNHMKAFVIAICSKHADSIGAANHELAHGFYYLNDYYREDMDRLTDNLPRVIRKKIERILAGRGYSEGVYKDELHAFMATDVWAEAFDEDVIKSEVWKLAAPYRKRFKRELGSIRFEIQ